MVFCVILIFMHGDQTVTSFRLTDLYDLLREGTVVVQGAIRIFVKDLSSPSHLHINTIITVENGFSRNNKIHTKYRTVSIYVHATPMHK